MSLKKRHWFTCTCAAPHLYLSETLLTLEQIHRGEQSADVMPAIIGDAVLWSLSASCAAPALLSGMKYEGHAETHVEACEQAERALAAISLHERKRAAREAREAARDYEAPRADIVGTIGRERHITRELQLHAAIGGTVKP